MKVKETIELECWDKWNGFIWRDTYAENIVEIKESELPITAEDYDWSWYEIPADWYEVWKEMPEYGREYIKIIVEFYPEDAEPGYDEPLVRISKLESDIWKERNA